MKKILLILFILLIPVAYAGLISSPPPLSENSPALQHYLREIYDNFHVLKVNIATPTRTPSEGQIESFTDGSDRKLYIYLDDAWRAIGVSTFTLPIDQTVSAQGEVTFDSTDDTLVIYNGGSAKVYAHYIKQASVIFEDDGDFTDDVIPFFQAPKDMAITLVQVDAACLGGTNITYNIEERAWGSLASSGTDIFASDQVADTTGEQETSFSNAGIAAEAHLVVVPSAESGNPDAFTATIYYSLNVE